MKKMLYVLFLSAAFATPSFANYFHNPHLNLSLNVGSAPSPTPHDLRTNRVPSVGRPAPSYADDGENSKSTGKTAANDLPRTQGGGGNAMSAQQKCGANCI